MNWRTVGESAIKAAPVLLSLLVGAGGATMYHKTASPAVSPSSLKVECEIKKPIPIRLEVVPLERKK